MTQEEKKLLLVDLSARLPYGIIAKYKSREKEGDVKITYGNIGYVAELGNGWWKECKPYLRPMSSMTEEERIESLEFAWIDDYGRLASYDKNIPKYIDWLNKKMFDYRGLIEKGLAIAVTEKNNPYKD